MFRATAGPLPGLDADEIAGVKIPQGRYVYTADSADTPVAWISSLLPQDQLQGLIDALAAVYPQTGLWPLQAKGLEDDNLARPWDDGELAAPTTDIPDALSVLTREKAEYDFSFLDIDEEDEDEEDEVPAVEALAAAEPGPDLQPAQLRVEGRGGLLLVPVGRPADVPAALGWTGATNLSLNGADISAVLRSWEERYGATLVSIGFDILNVQLARIPQTPAQFDGLLREHYTFCPDNIDQGLERDEYLEGLTEWDSWLFWWD